MPAVCACVCACLFVFQGSTETNDYLLIEDIEVGSTIDVFGRPFRIYDAEPATRKVAAEMLNRQLAPP